MTSGVVLSATVVTVGEVPGLVVVACSVLTDSDEEISVVLALVSAAAVVSAEEVDSREVAP